MSAVRSTTTRTLTRMSVPRRGAIITALLGALIAWGTPAASADPRDDIAVAADTGAPLRDVQLHQATEVCAEAWFNSGRDALVGLSLRELGLPRGADFLGGVRATDRGLRLLIDVHGGRGKVEHVFEFARVITAIAAVIPGAMLFGFLGTPALYCLQAALVVTQQTGKAVGDWLRQILFPDADANEDEGEDADPDPGEGSESEGTDGHGSDGGLQEGDYCSEGTAVVEDGVCVALPGAAN
jgi:hypothetical protein